MVFTILYKYLCCNSKSHLDNITMNNTIPFIPPVKECKVIKVYDGDTITIGCYLFGEKTPYRLSVRLRGIDSPELKTKNKNEHDHACISRDKLSEHILNKTIILENVATEKYGRILADVIYNGKNMNQWMVQNKYAVGYDGGTKQRDPSWDIAV